MKLSEYTKINSITYRTTWSQWKTGKIKGYVLSSGTIIIDDKDINKPEYKELDLIDS